MRNPDHMGDTMNSIKREWQWEFNLKFSKHWRLTSFKFGP